MLGTIKTANRGGHRARWALLKTKSGVRQAGAGGRGKSVRGGRCRSARFWARARQATLMGARGLVFVDSETSHTRKEARTVEYLWLATIEIPLYVTVNISELRTPLERRPRDLSNGVVFLS